MQKPMVPMEEQKLPSLPLHKESEEQKMRRGKVLIDVKDIIGKRLGKLEVISYYGRSYSTTRGGDRLRHYYWCQCECGNLHVVQRAQILNEIVHSCGCKRRGKHGY